MNQRGTAESVYIVIRRATALLLIASWTHLLQEFSRFCVAMAAVMNQIGRIEMLSILLLIKGKATLDTNQWTIVRVRRKQKGQRKFAILVVSRVVLPQLRRQERQQGKTVLPLFRPVLFPQLRREKEEQRK
jgi:hypothetical protein